MKNECYRFKFFITYWCILANSCDLNPQYTTVQHVSNNELWELYATDGHAYNIITGNSNWNGGL